MTKLTFGNRTFTVADETMAKTLEFATKAGRSDYPVLLCGESGTGKELIARYIHEKSDRSSEPFVSINCAAIPEGLLEAELFGYERGAFTGAHTLHIGRFERASKSTLLLDEISEMPLALQAKLLRALQEGEVDRLGGNKPVPVHTRVIATTNRDPLALIAERKFRDDLFYRLNVIRIDCSPLRGRTKAISVLTQVFLSQSSARHGRSTLSVSQDAFEKLFSHEWPGNIRELQNAVERAVFMCGGSVLKAEDFEVLGSKGKASGGYSLAAVERQHIIRTLENSHGNRTEAARILGITTRTLRNKLKEYGA